MKVRDIARPVAGRVSPETYLSEALRQILREDFEPSLLVVEEHHNVVGILSKGDILQTLLLPHIEKPAHDENAAITNPA